MGTAEGWGRAIVGSCLAVVAACTSPSAEDPPLDRWRGENAVAQERYDWARWHFRRDLEQHPEHRPSLRQEGLSWLSGYQQSLSTGVDRLSRYMELVGDDEEIEQRLVGALLLMGDRPAAVRWADQLEPSAVGWRWRAEAYGTESPSRAVEAVERALELAPDDGATHATAARLYDHLEDGERASIHAGEAVRHNPLDASSMYLLGRWHLRRGDNTEGRRWLQLQQLVQRLQADGSGAPSPAEALELMDAIEPQLPATPFLWHKYRLRLLFASGRLAAAEALLAASLDAADLARDDLLDIATWAGDAGRRRTARRLFERVLQGQPEHPGALASLALLELEAGDLEAAQRRLTTGLAARPRLARFYVLRGRVAVAQGRGDDARRDFEQAVLLAPWEWTWRVALCDILLAAGDAEAFAEVIEGAPEAPPGWQAYRDRHLGTSLPTR